MKPIFSAFLAAFLAASPATQAQAQALPSSTIDSIVAVLNETDLRLSGHGWPTSASSAASQRRQLPRRIPRRCSSG
jgi:hypothetical protein